MNDSLQRVTRCLGVGLFLASAPLLPAQFVPDNSLFTYQGHLSENGRQGEGLYDFEVQLFDGPGAEASSLTGVFPYRGVPVSDGLFVLNLDFGDGVFSGPHRYLEIKVRANGGGAFTTLSPRQRLASAPNAIYAEKAGGLEAGVNSTVFGTMTFDPVTGPPFLVDSTTKVPNLNSDLLDGFNSSAFVKRAGDSMTGTLVVDGPGGGIATLSHVVDFFGSDVDIGVDGSAASLLGVGVNGISTGARGTGVSGQATGSDGTGVWAGASTGSNSKALYAVSTNGYAGVFDGAVRINYSSPFNKAQLHIQEPNSAGFTRLRMQTGSQDFWDIAVGGQGAGNNLRFYRDGVGDVMWITPAGQLHTRVLTIMGGADIAEPFETGDDELPGGTVVVIDEKRPGQLRESDEAYDTRVAGVISGAGGVRTGLHLQQEDVLDGGQPVALTGRVYVRADASNGVINPGDLLTTADRPGHAMKVTEHARAQGAILGKAMTRLEEGTGLVLVLVTLQ